ncbi:MBL fold metallo-hydrolase [bacterium]|nr:MBL fold metallo-hydrolase [bacterium]
MKVTFMGSGTSLGVPTIACTCAVCTSDDPKNKRTRPSLLVSIDNKNFLIDTATDFRQQAIRENLKRVDAVLYTHSHADHILGLDDLRPFNFFQRIHIPCFGNEPTMKYICNMFQYVFTDPQPGGSIPRIEPRVISGTFDFLNIPIRPLPVLHGKLPVNGYRIGGLSYITDCSEIPDDTYRLLEGTSVLILGVLRREPHPTHLNVDKALEIICRVQPERAFFTHLSHDFDHDRANAELPDSVRLSYDGLSLEMEEAW